MKVALVALPWMDYQTPQPAVGALHAYLARREPSWEVDSIYAYYRFALRDPELYMAVTQTDFEGERVFATLLYPERSSALVRSWERLPADAPLKQCLDARAKQGKSPASILDELQTSFNAHLDELVASRSWNDTVVGMTTCYSQLFGNLALARRIKETGASATIVLGGATVSPAAIADSVLATYPWIDYVIRGEGELPLHALIGQLAAGEEVSAPAVVTRDRPAAEGRLWQVDDMTTLPVPDYDRYFEMRGSDSAGAMPIEGSRGCWWDRTLHNPKSTCHFCNLNVQWDGYRQKSGRQVAAEMKQLATRYRRTQFQFLDNIVRLKGWDELIDALSDTGIDARFFHEARSNLRPYQLLQFYEVGLRSVQFGIEALSDGVLRRINKGTSVIMNLEVMKTCAELRIRSISNLITNFPGTTKQEVDETVAIIDDYAFAYQPPDIARFQLGIESVVSLYPEDYGISNVRVEDRFTAVIPPGHLATLKMFMLSYDQAHRTDWSPVVERVRRWKDAYRPHPICYFDGGTFMRIVRRRPFFADEIFDLGAADAELYRYCTQIRTTADIHGALGRGSADRIAELNAALDRFCAAKIMYRQKERYLSLALAPEPALAARRIRRLHELDAVSPPAPALRVIG